MAVFKLVWIKVEPLMKELLEAMRSRKLPNESIIDAKNISLANCEKRLIDVKSQ